MRLLVLRHGETVENRGCIIQGQSHGTLTPLGEAQARLAAEHLREEAFDAVYASDLSRVQDTLLPLRRHLDVPIINDSRLREKAFGEFEGLPTQHYLDAYYASGQGILDYTPPGGESFGALDMRVKNFMTDLPWDGPNQLVLLATHGGVIRSLLNYFFNATWEKLVLTKVSNASISTFEYDQTGLVFVSFNSITHLQPAGIRYSAKAV